MTTTETLLIILLAAITWDVAAVLLGVLIGLSVRIADRRSKPRDPDADELGPDDPRRDVE